MDAVKTLVAGALALSVAGVVGYEKTKRVAPAPGCSSGRCVLPIEEARKMTTQAVSAPRAREVAAALDAAAKSATARATFALG